MFKNKNRGYSLVEMMLVFSSIAALTTIGFWIYGIASEKQRINTAHSQLASIQKGLNDMSGIYSDIDEARTMLLNSKALSSDMVSGNTLINAWKGKITITSRNGSNNFYNVSFYDVPSSSCIDLVSKSRVLYKTVESSNNQLVNNSQISDVISFCSNIAKNDAIIFSNFYQGGLSASVSTSVSVPTNPPVSTSTSSSVSASTSSSVSTSVSNSISASISTSASVSSSISASTSASISSSISASTSASISNSNSLSLSSSVSISNSIKASSSLSSSVSNSISTSISASKSLSTSTSASISSSKSASLSSSVSASISASRSASTSASLSVSASASKVASISASNSRSVSTSVSASVAKDTAILNKIKTSYVVKSQYIPHPVGRHPVLVGSITFTINGVKKIIYGPFLPNLNQTPASTPHVNNPVAFTDGMKNITTLAAMRTYFNNNGLSAFYNDLYNSLK